MEARRIELLSETLFPQLSTSVVYLLRFPVTAAGKQAAMTGSPNTFLRCGQTAGTFTAHRCPVKAAVLNHRTLADLGSKQYSVVALYRNVIVSVYI